jgi:ubiquinone biosynthesis monooxygenase Coq7
MSRAADRRHEMLRVDHAGEYGAVAIYRGQLAVFERRPGHARIVGQLGKMAGQEQAHLDAFDKLLAEGRVRPTALSPIWNVAGFALGAATALMGEKAAHACTEAVETVIEEHYGDQVAELEATGDADLAGRLARFRDEEVAHKDLAVAEGASQAPGYPLLSALIRTGCRLAIRISSKI